MSAPAVRVENLAKRYEVGRRAGTFRESVGRWLRLQRGTRDTFWALRDVSFELRTGEALGIIGRNGAGKSTLLKILSRITEPTRGRAELYGRLSSLLEVGTGFHPELSGRENVYLNGTILGMSRAEVRRRFDAIVDFSGVERFLDTPVKHYSSGMYVRLAFAVAAHLEPEILVVDEVLAVGDVEFQNKCLGKMSAVAAEGRTVLFVSHNMAAIHALCSRALLLDNGAVAAEGEVQACVDKYLGESAILGATWAGAGRDASAPLCFAGATLALEGAPAARVLRVHGELMSRDEHRPAIIAVDISDGQGSQIMQAVPTLLPFIPPSPAGCQVEVAIDLPPLIPGKYLVGLWVGPNLRETYDQIDHALCFEIVESPTENRSLPHDRRRGFLVPHSRAASEVRPAASDPTGPPTKGGSG